MEDEIAVGGSVSVHPGDADAGLVAVTVTWDDAEKWMRCDNCGQAKRTHSEDGKCLFEASSFKAPPPVEIIGLSWDYERPRRVKDWAPSMSDKPDKRVQKQREAQLRAKSKRYLKR